MGTCDEGLLCVADLCAPPAVCPFTRNGVCDEPVGGTGACFEGSDTFDCCPSEPGVCEEVGAGGVCPEGSDAQDCVPDEG